MEKQNEIRVAIIQDLFLHNNTQKFNENVKQIFQHIHKMNKGINFIEEENILSIDNKYYQCELNLHMQTFDGVSCKSCKEEESSAPTEGVIVYGNANDLKTERLSRLLNNLNGKPACSIILFEEDRSFLTSLCDFEKFVEFTIDNNMEIITNIKDFGNIEEDDGIAALSMSLQSCHWSNSVMKKDLTKDKKETKQEELNIDQNKDKDADSKEGYQQLKDENEFDNFIEKINEVRRMNLNDNMSDEERRKNAENAILMLAKFMNFDDADLDEEDQN